MRARHRLDVIRGHTVDSSLDFPDDPSWRTDSRYSTSAARLLVRAYAAIIARKTRPESYEQALNYARHCLAVAKSPHQRLRACYVLAMAHSSWNNHTAAVHWVDEALGLGFELDDRSALRDLLYLRGAVNTSRLHYRHAAEDHEDCLIMLRAQRNGSTSSDHVAFELTVSTQLAWELLLQSQPEAAERVLAESQALLANKSDLALDAITLQYVQAHIHRFGGMPEEALLPALRAAEIYTEKGSPESASRTQMFASDVVLDLAERAPEGIDRHGFLQMARPHLELAANLAREANDTGAIEMIQLRRARLGRLGSTDENRTRTIEDVVHGAWRRGDSLLLTEGYTTLGDELAARGERESALGCYRRALEVVDTSEHPAAGVWARRALNRDGEFHPM